MKNKKNLAQMYKTTCELIQILIEMSVQTSSHNPLIKSGHFASKDCFSFESVEKSELNLRKPYAKAIVHLSRGY